MNNAHQWSRTGGTGVERIGLALFDSCIVLKVCLIEEEFRKCLWNGEGI